MRGRCVRDWKWLLFATEREQMKKAKRPPIVTAADSTVSIMLVAVVAPHVTRTTLLLLPRRVFLITVSAFVRCRPALLHLFS